ncbi:MAG: alpha-L-fucosidase [Candidatus Hydrogenedentes bacterium]|nr:alpha-L-fucosidase [Candidatus Hydrogenedentota bacterium]
MRNQIIATVCAGFFGALASPGPANAEPVRYEPTWESLGHYAVPAWYLDAKFGIFIHWGPYAVPAFNSEWYPRNMYRKDHVAYKHHKETWGDQGEFGYKDFIPMFTAEKWDPAAWAALFEDAGAKYIVMVAEHHDGFAMYDSAYTKWNAADMGPKRDTVKELAQAVRARGLKFGASSHHAHNWNYYTFDDAFDTVDPANAGLYGVRHEPDIPASEAFLSEWYARTIEIIDKYQPDVLWFDFGFNKPEFEPWRRKVAAYYYNQGAEWGRGVALNYKDEAFPTDAAVLDIERGKLGELKDFFWQTDTSISVRSWGYIEPDAFRSVDSIVDDLVDIVSKNGCLLFNIGPRADGTIPDEVQERLRGVGQWLAVNGEAIYGTRPWRVFGEGPTEVTAGAFKDVSGKPFTAEDIRFTTKDGVIYAVALAKPSGRLKIKSLGKGAAGDVDIEGVELLGGEGPLEWRRSGDALAIKLPQEIPGEHAFVFKIAAKGK